MLHHGCEKDPRKVSQQEERYKDWKLNWQEQVEGQCGWNMVGLVGRGL